MNQNDYQNYDDETQYQKIEKVLNLIKNELSKIESNTSNISDTSNISEPFDYGKLENIENKLSEIETDISDIRGIHGTDLNDLKEEIKSTSRDISGLIGSAIFVLFGIIVILLTSLIHHW